MKNIYLLPIISIAIILTTSNLVYSQEKKTADIFDGFRDVLFYTQVSNYPNYNYKLINNMDSKKYDLYEFFIPKSESRFLETYINRMIVKQYKNNIVEITLILEDDIREVLKNMFVEVDDGKSKFAYLRGRSKKWIWLYEIDAGIELGHKTIYTFPGKKTEMDYGWKGKKINDYPSETHLSTNYNNFKEREYYLSIDAVDYKAKIDSQQTQKHFDTYLSDFGGKHYPMVDDKKVYEIPLFESDNIFYVRALFDDFVENLVFDTGADQLIISRNLYKKLKIKGLVKDTETIQKMITADGSEIELRKVIIENLQLYDLKVSFVEAYINNSDEISLLGQSFLKRFGGISIDYRTNILIIKKK